MRTGNGRVPRGSIDVVVVIAIVGFSRRVDQFLFIALSLFSSHYPWRFFFRGRRRSIVSTVCTIILGHSAGSF
jgi:hypothetical protein